MFESDGPINNQGKWSLCSSFTANLPNYRGLALKRLNSLQKRFLKDEHFMKCTRHLLQI